MVHKWCSIAEPSVPDILRPQAKRQIARSYQKCCADDKPFTSAGVKKRQH